MSIEQEGKEDKKNDGLDLFKKRIEDAIVTQIFMELSVVKDNTRSLVLVTHGFIELLVNTLADHYLKNSKKVTSDERSYPHSIKILLLNELGIIEDNQYKVFDWFRKLRNKAAHQPIFYVTKNDLKNLSPKKFRDPKNFYNFCFEFMGGFWNQHIPIFRTKFAPGLGGENDEADGI